jgi:hypothetical protein
MSIMPMPEVFQSPSPCYTPTEITHDLFFLHMMEGGCAGSVAWCCRKDAGATAHLFMNEDGTAVYQTVPLNLKAWAQCAFNGRGVSLEIPGRTSEGIPQARWDAACRIAAWYCAAYRVPPVWAKGGQGRGVCQHHDLGAPGGGHVDCSEVGSLTFLEAIETIQSMHSYFIGLPSLPAFALHGLPNPHQVILPPAVTPTPSHNGAPRIDPADDPNVLHPTSSGFPLASIGDWQWRLRKVGANPTLGVDDKEGKATRAAIGVFQKALGLPVTDEVNPDTWAKLFAATA